MQELSPALADADKYVKLTRRKKQLDLELKTVKAELETVQQKVLDHMEEGRLPESFRHDGASVFTRAEIWASAKDGDHESLAGVLSEMGMVEYLPKNVNSQSISAWVREHRNEETGEFDEDLIDPRMREVLKITVTNKAVVNGA